MDWGGVNVDLIRNGLCNCRSWIIEFIENETIENWIQLKLIYLFIDIKVWDILKKKILLDIGSLPYFTPTRYKGAPRPCQLKLVVWIHVNVPMVICVHVGTMAARVQGMKCIVLHIWRTIVQLKYTQDSE